MIRFARTTRLVTLFAALLLVVAACAPGTGSLGTPGTPAVTGEPSSEPSPSDVAPASPSPSVAPSPTEPETSATPTATPASSGTSIVRAYFVLGSFTDNPGLVPVLREVPKTKAVATAAMTALLAGPNANEMAASPAMYTSIPEGTRLLDISIDNAIATVNLSTEFKGAAANFQTGMANAQVVYTLTQFSTVDVVRIEVDGALLTTLKRSDLQIEGIIPAIFVDRPAWGAAIGNPGRVSGIANVFEATFRVQLRDAKDGILVDQQVMATCGTGCWGTFKVDLAYTVAKAQYGTLRVYDLSAKDGQPVNVTEYKVWLTPAK